MPRSIVRSLQLGPAEPDLLGDPVEHRGGQQRTSLNSRVRAGHGAFRPPAPHRPWPRSRCSPAGTGDRASGVGDNHEGYDASPVLSVLASSPQVDGETSMGTRPPTIPIAVRSVSVTSNTTARSTTRTLRSGPPNTSPLPPMELDDEE
jgi:hypothetical protein